MCPLTYLNSVSNVKSLSSNQMPATYICLCYCPLEFYKSFFFISGKLYCLLFDESLSIQNSFFNVCSNHNIKVAFGVTYWQYIDKEKHIIIEISNLSWSVSIHILKSMRFWNKKSFNRGTMRYVHYKWTAVLVITCKELSVK